MSVSRPLSYLGFAFWVSVCAAAPEFIWQGLLTLADHFTRQNAYSIILIGLILAVFVEPILERARDGRWTSEHRNRRSLLLTVPIALIFGLVSVGLHECMTAYLGASPIEHGAPPNSLARGFYLILEWAWVPFAVTLAWFGARLQGWAPYVAGVCAAVWVVGIGWAYGWPSRDIVMTSIPCLALIALGQWYIARNWNEATFRNLALGMAAGIALWLILALIVQAVLRMAAVTGIHLFHAGDFWEDVRFYLGWVIGLALAPNPVPAESIRTDCSGSTSSSSLRSTARRR